jgi:hypothetical protein
VWRPHIPLAGLGRRRQGTEGIYQRAVTVDEVST